MAFKTDLPNTDLFAGAKKDVRNKVTMNVDEIAELVAELKEVEAEVAAAKEELRELAKAEYFKQNFQKQTPVHTFDARGRHNDVQLNFQNAYNLDKEKLQKLQTLLRGTTLVDQLQERQIVNVDVTDLPKEDRTEFYKACKELCDEFGLEGFVDDKYVVAPEFHDERHDLIIAVNQAVDKIMPIQVHITT